MYRQPVRGGPADLLCVNALSLASITCLEGMAPSERNRRIEVHWEVREGRKMNYHSLQIILKQTRGRYGLHGSNDALTLMSAVCDGGFNERP